MGTISNFRQPMRNLAQICAGEDLPQPVARILKESSRLSVHPLFVVGVYSGKHKIGEGAGSSIDEAIHRSALAALSSWYLYSPRTLDIISNH